MIGLHEIISGVQERPSQQEFRCAAMKCLEVMADLPPAANVNKYQTAAQTFAMLAVAEALVSSSTGATLADIVEYAGRP